MVAKKTIQASAQAEVKAHIALIEITVAARFESGELRVPIMPGSEGRGKCGGATGKGALCKSQGVQTARLAQDVIPGVSALAKPSVRWRTFVIIFLRHNIFAARRFTADITFEQFRASDLHFYATMRALEVVSEAARRLWIWRHRRPP